MGKQELGQTPRAELGVPGFNCKVVSATLQEVVGILEANKIEYRIYGSVVVSAINGKQHRNLGDLDILVDSKGKDLLYSSLIELGYTPAKGVYDFARKYLSLETLRHPQLLEIGYNYGDWGKDGSFTAGGKYLNMKFDPFAVKKTKYKLHGIEFDGIPEQAVAKGVENTGANPKRNKDLEVLKEKHITPFSRNFIHPKILNIPSDRTYYLMLKGLDRLGTARAKLGLSFDPWG